MEQSESKKEANKSWRWAVLIIVILLGVGNAMGWLTFAPVPTATVLYFGITTNQVDLFSMIYMGVGLPAGFFAIWISDGIGFRKATWITIVFYFVGASLRVGSVAFIEFDENNEFLPCEKCFPVALIGTALMGTSQAFVGVLPTLMASRWFEDKERLLANSLASLSICIGLMLASIAAPLITKGPEDLFLESIWFALPVLAAIPIAFFIPSDGILPCPKTIPFFNRLRHLASEGGWEFSAAVLLGAIRIGHNSMVQSLIVQLLCPAGYSNIFSSTICATLIIGPGVAFSMFLTRMIGGSEHHALTAKICAFVSIASNVAFSFAIKHSGQEILIASLCVIYGMSTLVLLPLSCEMAAETAYPVGGGTAGGLVCSLGEIIGPIFIYLSGLVPTGFTPEGSSCFEDQGQDLTNFMLILDGCCLFLLIIFAIRYKCSFKRRKAMEETKAQTALLE